MKIRKRLIAWLMMTVMILGILPMNVQAAESGESSIYVFSSKAVKCARYDLDGDGKKDVVQYKPEVSPKFRIYVNKKEKFIDKSSCNSSTLLLFNVKNDRTYLIASMFTSAGRVETEAFYYQGGRFKEVKNIQNYGKVKFENMYFKSYSADKLYMCSAKIEQTEDDGLLAAFRKSQENVGIIVPFRFRNGKISICSLTAKPYAKTTLKFKSTGIFTSTTPKLTDSDGPAVRPGREFTVEKFYIAGKEKITCQISYNGEKGWFNCSRKDIVLIDMK